MNHEPIPGISDISSRSNVEIIKKGDRLNGFVIPSGSVLYYFRSIWLENSELPEYLLELLIEGLITHTFLLNDDKGSTSYVAVDSTEKFLSDHLGEGLFIVNKAGKISYVNHMFCQMFETSRIDVIGRKVSQVIHGSQLEEDELLTSWAKNENRSVKLVETGETQGEKRFYEVAYSPVIEQGRIDHFCGIIRDITLQQKLHVSMDKSNNHLAQKNQVLENLQNATIMGFSRLAEYKDQETGGHLERIQGYVKALGFELYRREVFFDFETRSNYLNTDYIEELSLSALLHDIGKVGIPDRILQKPGRLSSEEFLHMQLHAKIGGDTMKWLNEMVGEETFLALAKEVAYYHHEQ